MKTPMPMLDKSVMQGRNRTTNAMQKKNKVTPEVPLQRIEQLQFVIRKFLVLAYPILSKSVHATIRHCHHLRAFLPGLHDKLKKRQIE